MSGVWRTRTVRSGEICPCSSARCIMLKAMRSFTLQGTLAFKSTPCILHGVRITVACATKALPAAWLHQLQLACDVGEAPHVHPVEVYLHEWDCGINTE